MEADREDTRASAEPPPEEGGGPPTGTPWTLQVDGDDGWSADLEHAAPIPRVGERIDFIGEGAAQRSYRVIEVIHTLQPAPDSTPAGRDSPGLLRAGLPRVIAVPAEE
ncbi:MAG: hypothetical protein K5924_11995 [Chloroflexi bacterium]|nr:hypothetical protein [Chloroflexota bacterium]